MNKTEIKCALCNEYFMQNTPVLIVDDQYAIHFSCWRIHCGSMTHHQMKIFIEKKIAERKSKQ
mgnify:FL=1